MCWDHFSLTLQGSAAVGEQKHPQEYYTTVFFGGDMKNDTD